MKDLRCLLGFHQWHIRGRCVTRAVILAGISNHGGDDRVCLRCGLEDNDMLNCSHGHRRLGDGMTPPGVVATDSRS